MNFIKKRRNRPQNFVQKHALLILTFVVILGCSPSPKISSEAPTPALSPIIHFDADKLPYQEVWLNANKETDSTFYIFHSKKRIRLTNPELLTGLPEFPGGRAEFQKYTDENLQYPDSFHGEGSLISAVLIGPKGKCLEMRIVKDIPKCFKCRSAATNLLLAVQQWKPARGASGEATMGLLLISVVF